MDAHERLEGNHVSSARNQRPDSGELPRKPHMTLRRIPLLFACTIVLMLAGCGFHPRGELVIPAELGPVRVVSSDPYSPLADSLSRDLTRAGVTAAAAPKKGGAKACVSALPSATGDSGGSMPTSAVGAAGGSAIPALPTGGGCAEADDSKVSTLRIVSEGWTEIPLSVDAFEAVHEYNLTYTVKFAFTASDNTDVAPLQVVKLQRDFVYDVNHALGAAAQDLTIRREMQRDMAATIFRRISIALRHYKS
jgi:LPS-assembly lipoprotein